MCVCLHERNSLCFFNLRLAYSPKFLGPLTWCVFIHFFGQLRGVPNQVYMLIDIWVSGTTVNTGPVCAHLMFYGVIGDSNDYLSLGSDSQVVSALEAGSAERCCSLEVKCLFVSVCVCVWRIRQSHDAFVCVDVCENVFSYVYMHSCVCSWC